LQFVLVLGIFGACLQFCLFFEGVINHLNVDLAALLFVVGVNQNSVSLALKQVVELRLLVGNHMLLDY
jgi:hypothetical protein